MKILNNDMYLLLIDEEAEIKEGNYRAHIYEKTLNHPVHRLEHGENTFDTWKLVLAYYPLTKEAKELDLPLLPSFEESIKIVWLDFNKNHNRNCPLSKEQFVRAINYKSASKQFSLEDMKKAFEAGANWQEGGTILYPDIHGFTQSLSTQQTYPKEFIPEYEDRVALDGHTIVGKELKTITNSEDKEELVETYR